MTSSERWVKAFLSSLECVKCRRKYDLTLWSFLKKRIVPNAYTIKQLREQVDRMDAWCPTCEVKINTRVTGPGRLRHKKDAAFLADVAVGHYQKTAYDTHVLSNGGRITKGELVDSAKNRPCAVCGQHYPPEAMDLHHIVYPKVASIPTMIGGSFTIQEVVDEIEKCACVCAVCHRLLHSGKVQLENAEPIKVDRNFFARSKKE